MAHLDGVLWSHPCARRTVSGRRDDLAAARGVPGVELQALLSAMGKMLGPPWTQDEKLSVAAALSIPHTV
jgi:hypothetical protein